MSEFYKGKNVAVLGGAGFVGRHLCRALVRRGANVSVIDDYSRCGGLVIDKNFNVKAKSQIDITMRRVFANVLSHINPFAVFNLAAAVAGVEYNQKHQNQMFLDNAQLQTIPVMVCEKLSVPHFLQVSSACVYGEDANAPAIEANLGGDPVGSNAGYSWAKRMGERAVQWSNMPHAVIVRPSNIYGPGDWYDKRAHVIPKLIKGYINGTAKMFSISPVREFIYVEDVAEGMLHALEFGSNKEPYNLGIGEVVSINQLHGLIAQQLNLPLAPMTVSDFSQGDVARYSDCSKIRELGWKHETPLDIGFTKTIRDYETRR